MPRASPARRLVPQRRRRARSRAGSYGLGTTEWEDVDAALAFAHARGARRIILMGWSMGGAIALQTALLSSRRTEIVGLILESPVIDWRSVLDFQAKLARVPTPVSDLAMGALGREWAPRVLGADGPIKLDELDLVARAQELSRPVLVLHSDDDGFVPSGASHELKDARPDIVDLEVFSVARHASCGTTTPRDSRTRSRRGSTATVSPQAHPASAEASAL